MGVFQSQRPFFSGGIADLFLVTLDDGRSGVLRRLKWRRCLSLRVRRQFVLGMRLREQVQADGHIVRSWLSSAGGLLPYEVLEFIPGHDLKWQMTRRAYLVRRDYRQVLAGAARGLHRIHRAGFMHLDVKPENYLAEYRQEDLKQVKLTDFDLARPADDHACRLGGTRRYLAPEQLLQKLSYQASDVFAFGVMAYRLIGGRMPFEGADPRQALRHQASETVLAEPLDEFVPDVDRKWSNAVMRCLVKRHRQRYPDISAFLDDVL